VYNKSSCLKIAEHRIPYNGVAGFPTNVTLTRFLELHIEITGDLPDPTSGDFLWKIEEIVEIYRENLFLKVKSWSDVMCVRRNPTATSACTAKRKSAPTAKAHTWTFSVVKSIE
jgi:hypothetical protein